MFQAATSFAALLGLLLAAGSARAQGQGPPPPASEPAEARLSPDAIELSDQLQTKMGEIQDGGDWHSRVLPDLIDRVAQMNPLAEEAFGQLENPSYRKLTQLPNAYRAQPIRHRVYVATVTPMPPSRRFPTDKTFWILGCWSAESKEGYNDKPIMVLSTVDPSPHLGQPDAVNPEDDTRFYRRKGTVRKLEIAAILYKVAQGRNIDVQTGAPEQGPQRKWPVLISWQIGTTTQVRGWMDKALPFVLAGGLLVLLLAFSWVWKRVRAQRKQGAGVRKYQPLRNEEQQEIEQIEQQGHVPVEDPQKAQADGPVDPALTEAAREYRKQEGSDADHTD
jgi:hypothetical protein